MSGSNYAHCDAWRECLRESTKVFYDSFDGLVIPEGTVILHPECAAARDAAAEERGRQQMIATVERQGSMLCDCDHDGGSTPTNPKNGAVMDHHCDCQAVRAAAMMLRAYSKTVHAAQCDHGTEFDEGYVTEVATDAS